MSGLHCAGERRHARVAIEKEIRCTVAATLAEFGNSRGKSCAAITAYAKFFPRVFPTCASVCAYACVHMCVCARVCVCVCRLVSFQHHENEQYSV